MEVRWDSGFNVVTRCTVPGTAALTFDDGPFQYTNEVVAMLKAANAIGTFFYNGKNFGCIYDKDSVDRAWLVYNSGHQIASHTWSHADLTTLSQDQINDEMYKVENALTKILGISPAFIRPPYGKYNDLVLQVASSRQQTVVTWDFDSQDSAGASADAGKNLYSQLIEKHPDTILTLNHETSDGSVRQVLPFAIQKLQAAGYRLVSVAECVGKPAYINVGPPQARDGSWTC
ncbi:carbohydrate esterase family 4 protein [Ephemerocybe angulata]|uniref:Carbohydrate esterase family 4 protein n=1 Tax=Ephemerocybe angulata TaxID=980116 RepID=A0A8H6MEM6_9AGAR|nr:carbohydrate esterase family 4 protein [Tulosesus angulatus]